MIGSRDLVDWERIGSAMEPLESGPPFYWAPEVTYSNGRFYLYYSCGNETLMEIRVAVSERPAGGFVDSGRRLTHEEFAIDAHVFQNEDGQKYLFYATDFLGHTHIGTGTVVDKMLDWFELEGKPKPVTRASFDWQMYDPQRVEKGGVRWHTVEGPTVFKNKNKYFQMFSGGNWKNSTYGVGFATSDTVANSDEWLQSIDGESVFPILKTVPERVIGPGHNSAVTGPNGRELFCVYHSWVGDARVMSIDRMDFVADRLFVNGPTVEPQAVPFRPSLTLESLAGGSVLRLEDAGSIVPLGRVSANFLLELTLRLTGADDSSGIFAIAINGGEGVGGVTIEVTAQRVSLISGSMGETVVFPESVDLAAFQVFRLELNRPKIGISLDGLPVAEFGSSVIDSGQVTVEMSGVACEIVDLLLTEGFVDLFDDAESPAAGWENVAGDAAVKPAEDGILVINQRSDVAIVAKGDVFDDFEFAVNLKRIKSQNDDGSLGFALLDERNQAVGRFEINEIAGKMYFVRGEVAEDLRLPQGYSPESYRQFRFVRRGGILRVESEERFLGEVNVGTFAARIGILCKGAVVGLDMVRSIRIG